MFKYQVSDKFTTADIGLEVTADALGELFVGAAQGMFAIVLGKSRPNRTIRGSIILHLTEQNVEQLLVDWLSELLYLFDGEGKIPVKIAMDLKNENGTYRLGAGIDFALFDEVSDQAEHEIKAVTYYKLKIQEGAEGFNCQVVFDL